MDTFLKLIFVNKYITKLYNMYVANNKHSEITILMYYLII